VVIVRHDANNNATLKFRWWLIRASGGWKVYDLEDLDSGMRLSTTIAVVLNRDFARSKDTSRAVVTLGEAVQAAIQDDLDTADKKLQQIAAVKLPPSIEANRYLIVGMLRVRQARPAEAIEALDKAATYRKDMPGADLVKGCAYNQLNQWDKARERIEVYRAILGEDATVCAQLGLALRGLGRFAEAAKQYRKALDFNPKDADAFQGLLFAMEWNANFDDIGPRFAKLDARAENFEIFAADCEERKFDALTERLAEVMRKQDPSFAPADYYLAMVRVRAGKPDEAVTLYRAALAKQKDADKRKHYTSTFLIAMATAGHVAKAYALAPNGRDAFRTMAAELHQKHRIDDLKVLIAAHAREHKDDPLLALYQASLHVHRGRYALADRTFAAALVKPPDEETLAAFRSDRVLARHYTGRTLSAYQEIGPPEETFLQLATLCFDEEEDTILKDLLDAHANADPASFDVLRFRTRLLIRQGQTDAALSIFKSALAKPVADEKLEEMEEEVLSDLAGAGKSLEAYRAAPDGKKAFLVLVRHLQGDGKREEQRQLLAAHRAVHPADPWLTFHEGQLHVSEEAWDKAAVAFRSCLDRAEANQRYGFQYQWVHAMYKAGRGMQAYNESRTRTEAFTQLANLFANDRKGTELQALVNAHRANAVDDVDVYFVEARARILLSKPAEATALFAEGCRKSQATGERGAYQVMRELTDEGLALDAYRAATDKTFAFQTMAAYLLAKKKDKELASLLTEYAPGRGNDQQCLCYSGELSLLRGDFDAADRWFTAALANATRVEQWRARQGVFRARVKAGKAVSAYQDVKSDINNFLPLANLCVEEKDVRQLQALIDAHRMARPDDDDLAIWDVEVKWLSNDYEGTLKLLTDRREEFDTPSLRWKANDRLVRALVKLKRNADAVRQAEAATKKRFDYPLLLVLAHAAAGDAKQAAAVVEKNRPNAYLVAMCYRDPDLGPLLRSEAFREFRAKYPEPKDVPDPDD
jgi:tetratricopeptide (TPR) repeat protein